MAQYKENLIDNFLIPDGLSEKSQARLRSGKNFKSVINKINIIKLANNYPETDSGYRGDERFTAKTAYDLCRASDHMGAVQYEIEDFQYHKWFGLPIGKMITLRRFPYPVTDNIYDKFNQAEPDIARMVTYTTNDNNKLEDVLSFGYRLKWKELNSQMESASMEGDKSGFSGLAKKVMRYIDPVAGQNSLRGENRLAYDPTHDSNKTYGPVDSLSSTNIRDVGLEFEKKFELLFEYDLKAIDGANPEMAMKDILSNVLACTYNNAKFWPGSRFWLGERPSSYLGKFKYLAPDSVDDFFSGAFNDLKSSLSGVTGSSAIDSLKDAISNGFALNIGKFLDKVGRPSIPIMNSLLSGEPVGDLHVMIGNPYNPIMCIGNLIAEDVQVKFPTESLSYGEFPTKMHVTISLKPAMPKDKAGIEMMFNMGKSRIYHQAKSVEKSNNPSNVNRTSRSFNGFDSSEIEKMIGNTVDFVADGTYNVITDVLKTEKTGGLRRSENDNSAKSVAQNKLDVINNSSLI